jgi:hypothetical protein
MGSTTYAAYFLDFAINMTIKFVRQTKVLPINNIYGMVNETQERRVAKLPR